MDRRLNLGGTLICDRALLNGDVDVYVEYTGTALTAIFKQPVSNDAASVYATVREQYARTGRTLLPPLGFNNTFAILVRGRDARERSLRTIDDAGARSAARGAPDSDTSFSNGRTATQGSRRPTGCGFASRRT